MYGSAWLRGTSSRSGIEDTPRARFIPTFQYHGLGLLRLHLATKGGPQSSWALPSEKKTDYAKQLVKQKIPHSEPTYKHHMRIIVYHTMSRRTWGTGTTQRTLQEGIPFGTHTVSNKGGNKKSKRSFPLVAGDLIGN